MAQLDSIIVLAILGSTPYALGAHYFLALNVLIPQFLTRAKLRDKISRVRTSYPLLKKSHNLKVKSAY
jgi:hypothetical protein